MQLSEVKQVKQVIGEANANGRLREGWVLLAVVPAVLKNDAGASALYVLGKSEPAERPANPLEGLKAEDLIRANKDL